MQELQKFFSDKIVMITSFYMLTVILGILSIEHLNSTLPCVFITSLGFQYYQSAKVDMCVRALHNPYFCFQTIEPVVSSWMHSFAPISQQVNHSQSTIVIIASNLSWLSLFNTFVIGQLLKLQQNELDKISLRNYQMEGVLPSKN